MLPARSIAGLLEAHSEIDHVRQHLHMPLWLHPATHHAKGQQWLLVFHDEARDDRLEWTLARRVDIGVSGLHRKQFAAILEHKAEPGNNNAASHAAIIALDQADHVAFIVGGA